MSTLLFSTGNQRKLGEARLACHDFGIDIEQVQFDIIEIQHHDPLEIAKHKASEAHRLAQAPVVVADTSWSIPALHGFPGGYMKDIVEWLSPEDFITLMATKDDRRVSFTETIVYTNNAETKIFSHKYWGVVATSPRGKGNTIEQIAEFNGQTIAERRGKGQFSHDPKEYVWYQFATWFADRNTEL